MDPLRPKESTCVYGAVSLSLCLSEKTFNILCLRVSTFDQRQIFVNAGVLSSCMLADKTSSYMLACMENSSLYKQAKKFGKIKKKGAKKKSHFG